MWRLCQSKLEPNGRKARVLTHATHTCSLHAQAHMRTHAHTVTRSLPSPQAAVPTTTRLGTPGAPVSVKPFIPKLCFMAEGQESPPDPLPKASNLGAKGTRKGMLFLGASHQDSRVCAPGVPAPAAGAQRAGCTRPRMQPLFYVQARTSLLHSRWCRRSQTPHAIGNRPLHSRARGAVCTTRIRTFRTPAAGLVSRDPEILNLGPAMDFRCYPAWRG